MRARDLIGRSRQVAYYLSLGFRRDELIVHPAMGIIPEVRSLERWEEISAIAQEYQRRLPPWDLDPPPPEEIKGGPAGNW